jgi:cation:H+ antiporter
VGNVLGSNVFNTLLVLGLAVTFITGGMAVAEEIIIDIIIMTAVSLALIPTLLTQLKLTRGEGAIMLGLYILYIAYLAMRQGAF